MGIRPENFQTVRPGLEVGESEPGRQVRVRKRERWAWDPGFLGCGRGPVAAPATKGGLANQGFGEAAARMWRKPWLGGSTRARSSCRQCEELQLGRTANKNETEERRSCCGTKSGSGEIWKIRSIEKSEQRC